MIIQLPNGETAEFPDNMKPGEIEAVLQKQFPSPKSKSGQIPSIPELISQNLGDPTSESLNMFQPGGVLQKSGELAQEYAPEIGLIAGGTIGSLGGPLSIPAAGMGYAAGKMAQSGFKGEQPPAPLEDIKNLGMGMVYEAGGQVIGKLATRLFAPAAGKISEGMKKGIEWLEFKKLPFSADIAGTGRISQGVADWMGFGRLFTNHQRKKLAQGINQTVDDIAGEIGIPSSRTFSETAAGISDFMQQVSQKGPYYENFNKIVADIPETNWPNTLQAIEALGQGGRSRLSSGLVLDYKKGLDAIRTVYGKTKVANNLARGLEDLISREGKMTGKEANDLINQLWIATKYEKLGQGEHLVKRLKEGFLADMETMTLPGTAETLATIRRAADQATHEALKWLGDSSLTGKFLRVQMQGNKKVYLPAWEKQAESGLSNLITPITKNDVLELKQKMIQAGKEDLWDATKLAYLQDVFRKSVKNDNFSPDNFLQWYNKYGKVTKEVMSEQAPFIDQWANISQAIGKDIDRLGAGQVMGGLAVGAAIGGLEAARTGDASKLISVPASFSLLAALGTMGPGNLAFLRKWALKETSHVAAPLAGYAARIGGVEAMKEQQ